MFLIWAFCFLWTIVVVTIICAVILAMIIAYRKWKGKR